MSRSKRSKPDAAANTARQAPSPVITRRVNALVEVILGALAGHPPPAQHAIMDGLSARLAHHGHVLEVPQ